MGRGKSVFASKNLWFKSNGSSNGVRKDEAAAAKREQQRSNDSGEVAVEWYAKRDIDRASEFIDRVHRGMLTDASGEQDG
ncbi:hypothetical protein OsJ_01254 [Oryza sativa Japonica Group]|uniref:Uncharacterized protein n=1 Tax=Oryza sativa subsp. japonica TaxID=39947 RepID=B9EV59_ORYSJ|nr:hypothetical protein OsJ_01254 [Oryza sativa Japonica Group]